MYAALPYAVATGVVELPYLLVQACIFVPLCYFMIGFRTAVEPIFLFIIIFMQSISLYTFMGQLFSYLAPNAPVATMLGGLCHLIWNIFNGFLVPFPQMAVGWRWLNWGSATTYVIYGLATSQLGESNQPIVVPGTIKHNEHKQHFRAVLFRGLIAALCKRKNHKGNAS
jgi:ABC-type multidrug transport system permease subunit